MRLYSRIYVKILQFVIEFVHKDHKFDTKTILSPSKQSVHVTTSNYVILPDHTPGCGKFGLTQYAQLAGANTKALKTYN